MPSTFPNAADSAAPCPNIWWGLEVELFIATDKWRMKAFCCMIPLGSIELGIATWCRCWNEGLYLSFGTDSVASMSILLPTFFITWAKVLWVWPWPYYPWWPTGTNLVMLSFCPCNYTIDVLPAFLYLYIGSTELLLIFSLITRAIFRTFGWFFNI